MQGRMQSLRSVTPSWIIDLDQSGAQATINEIRYPLLESDERASQAPVTSLLLGIGLHRRQLLPEKFKTQFQRDQSFHQVRSKGEMTCRNEEPTSLPQRPKPRSGRNAPADPVDRTIFSSLQKSILFRCIARYVVRGPIARTCQ